MAGVLQVGCVLAVLGVLHVPLGNYMAHVYTTNRHWRVERSARTGCRRSRTR